MKDKELSSINLVGSISGLDVYLLMAGKKNPLPSSK